MSFQQSVPWGIVFNFFRRKRRATDLRVRSRSERSASVRPDLVDLSAFAPSLDQVIAGVAYRNLAEFTFMAGWLGAIDDVDDRATVAAISVAMNKKFKKLRKELAVRVPEVGVGGMIHMRDAIDELYSLNVPDCWQKALLQAYIVSGIFDDGMLHVVSRLPGVPRVLDAVLLDRRGDEPTVELLAAQIESGAISRDSLALWGRAVCADALLAVRAQLILPASALAALGGAAAEDSATAVIAQIEAMQSQLVSEHTLRMDALNLTA